MNRRPRLAVAAAAFLLVAVALSGCTGTQPELQQKTAAQLQSGVLAVTVAAAAGDYAGARGSLGTVQADLLTAAAGGQVGAARSARIQSAINLVAADLAAELAASTPTPTPTPSGDPGNGDGNGKSGGKSDKCSKKGDCGD